MFYSRIFRSLFHVGEVRIRDPCPLFYLSQSSGSPEASEELSDGRPLPSSTIYTHFRVAFLVNEQVGFRI